MLQISRDDGKGWEDAISSHAITQPILYTVPTDGRYGFRLIAIDAVGNREKKPAAPEITVVVDTETPSVTIHNPAPQRFYKAGASLMLHWEVRDANLRPNSVTVRYALNNETRFRMHKEELDQIGKLALPLPENTQSIRVRVDTRDLAGNEGHTELGTRGIQTPIRYRTRPTESKEYLAYAGCYRSEKLPGVLVGTKRLHDPELCQTVGRGRTERRACTSYARRAVCRLAPGV